MKWHSDKQVKWSDIFRNWMISAVIITVLFMIFLRDDPVQFAIVMASSLPVYMGIGYVLVKLGLERKPPGYAKVEDTSSGSTNSIRPKPAPTKRTGGGTPKRSHKKRR